MAYARKVDNNQAQIVRALRDCGLSVAITSSVGNGFPDLAVGGRTQKTDWEPITLLVELKRPEEYRRPGHGLTEAERAFHDSYKGAIMITDKAEDVLAYFGIWA